MKNIIQRKKKNKMQKTSRFFFFFFFGGGGGGGGFSPGGGALVRLPIYSSEVMSVLFIKVMCHRLHILTAVSKKEMYYLHWVGDIS